MPSEQLKLRIFQVNDVYELENFPSFKTLVDSNRGDADQVLIVLAGDFLGPSLLSSLDKGRGMVDAMMMCGFTHVCFGNHETDIPSDAIADRVLQSDFVWLNTNMRNLDDKLDVETTPHDIVKVSNGSHSKKVGLLGLLTEDPSLYRPGSFAGATIDPVLECTEVYLKDQMPKDCDLIIPLTHQRMPADRDFATKFTGETFPLIIGGHDHDAYDEICSGSRIYKCGHDAQSTGIIDITWDIVDGVIADKPSIEAQLVDTTSYEPDPDVEKRVLAHLHILEELNKAKLFRFENWISVEEEGTIFVTEKNRVGPSNGTTVLTSILRMGMRAQCCIVNAGTVRGNKIYDPKNHEWFSWSDLKTEIPFPTEMVSEMRVCLEMYLKLLITL
jgi:5'-nucleotidase